MQKEDNMCKKKSCEAIKWSGSCSVLRIMRTERSLEQSQTDEFVGQLVGAKGNGYRKKS